MASSVSMIPEVGVKHWMHFVKQALITAGQDAELGGMQLPCLLEKAGFAWFNGANVSTSAYPMLSIGNANTLLKCGSPEQIERNL
jgi:alkylation response protein AidB-like acyl-CoA dehydrogenase